MNTNSHISSIEIEQDIQDTEAEIKHMEREVRGLRSFGDRMSCYRADARVTEIAKRREFITKLRGMLDERAQDRHLTSDND